MAGKIDCCRCSWFVVSRQTCRQQSSINMLQREFEVIAELFCEHHFFVLFCFVLPDCECCPQSVALKYSANIEMGIIQPIYGCVIKKEVEAFTQTFGRCVCTRWNFSLNLLNLCHVSIWERARQERLERRLGTWKVIGQPEYGIQADQSDLFLHHCPLCTSRTLLSTDKKISVPRT